MIFINFRWCKTSNLKSKFSHTYSYKLQLLVIYYCFVINDNHNNNLTIVVFFLYQPNNCAL